MLFEAHLFSPSATAVLMPFGSSGAEEERRGERELNPDVQKSLSLHCGAIDSGIYHFTTRAKCFEGALRCEAYCAFHSNGAHCFLRRIRECVWLACSVMQPGYYGVHTHHLSRGQVSERSSCTDPHQAGAAEQDQMFLSGFSEAPWFDFSGVRKAGEGGDAPSADCLTGVLVFT